MTCSMVTPQASSIIELQSKLHDPSAVSNSLTTAVAAGAIITEAIRVLNCAKGRVRDTGVRDIEVWSIRRVEHLPSELEAILLVIEWEVLHDRHIQVFLCGPPDEIPTRGPEGPCGTRLECLCVEVFVYPSCPRQAAAKFRPLVHLQGHTR